VIGSTCIDLAAPHPRRRSQLLAAAVTRQPRTRRTL